MNAARTILALDAAGNACSAALWQGGTILAERVEIMSRGHSERLLPMAGEVMTEAGQAFDGLDTIAVTRGPGGFTGVRIGLAAARGLALACSCRLIGVTSFEAYAGAIPTNEVGDLSICVVIESKRAELYLQCFDSALVSQSEPLVAAPADLVESLPDGPLLLAGDACETLLPILTAAGRKSVSLASTKRHVEARWVAEIAARRPLPNDRDEPPGPIYLRAPDATLPNPQVRRR